MTQTDARQGLQTNGSDVRTRAPPERTVKTPSRSFWHIGWKQPHMTNVSTKPHRYRQMGAEHQHPGIFGTAP